MDRNTIAIGIDHGWANMKTVHTIFTSEVKEITTEPALFSNVLEYKGKYFKIGGNRLEVKKNKVSDDNYYQYHCHGLLWCDDHVQEYRPLLVST